MQPTGREWPVGCIKNVMRHEAPSRDDVKIMLSFMPWRRATDATDTRGCSAYAMRGHQTLEEASEGSRRGSDV